MNRRVEIAYTKEPVKIKRMAKKLTLRPDWEEIKVDIMYRCVLNKFISNWELGQKLIATGDIYLIEGNNWNDTFWGVTERGGYNILGIILMNVRKIIKHLNIYNQRRDSSKVVNCDGL